MHGKGCSAVGRGDRSKGGAREEGEVVETATVEDKGRKNGIVRELRGKAGGPLEGRGHKRKVE